jgi:hypothetical protein
VIVLLAIAHPELMSVILDMLRDDACYFNTAFDNTLNPLVIFTSGAVAVPGPTYAQQSVDLIQPVPLFCKPVVSPSSCCDNR